MLQIIRTPQVFDVVVIGSGAGGGTAVKVLTDRGLNVALLEAGPMLNPAKDFKEHCCRTRWITAAPARTPRCISAASSRGYFAAPNGYWDIAGEPYTVAPGQPVQVVPLAHRGRTHQPLRPHLAALLRLRFQARRTAWATDWPVTYEEMSP